MSPWAACCESAIASSLFSMSWISICGWFAVFSLNSTVSVFWYHCSCSSLTLLGAVVRIDLVLHSHCWVVLVLFVICCLSPYFILPNPIDWLYYKRSVSLFRYLTQTQILFGVVTPFRLWTISWRNLLNELAVLVIPLKHELAVFHDMCRCCNSKRLQLRLGPSVPTVIDLFKQRLIYYLLTALVLFMQHIVTGGLIIRCSNSPVF